MFERSRARLAEITSPSKAVANPGISRFVTVRFFTTAKDVSPVEVYDTTSKEEMAAWRLNQATWPCQVIAQSAERPMLNEDK